MPKINLSAGERRMVLDLLYDKLVQIGDQYHGSGLTRRDAKRLRAERKRVAILINRLEGMAAVQPDEEP